MIHLRECTETIKEVQDKLICKKSINTLRQIMDRIFHKTDCATLTIFWGMYSLAKVTTWQSSSIGCFFVFARHGRALTGESPEHAQVVGNV